MSLLTLLCLLILGTCLPAQELDENAIVPDAGVQDVAGEGGAVPEVPQQPGGIVDEEVPEQPGGTGAEVAPEQPGETGVEEVPEQPGDVVVEETPEQPGETGAEVAPEQPGETGAEVAPEQPGETGVEEVPEQPGETGAEVAPEQPGETGAEEVPEQPGDVVVEETPEQPGETGDEVAPQQPGGVVGEEGAGELPESGGLPQQAPQGAPSGFVCPEREGRFPRPEQCQTYYLCSRGIAYVAWCQGGLHFSPTSKACENPATAGCGVTVQTTVAPATPAPPQIELPEVCLAAKPEENCGWWQYARYYYNPEMDRCFRFRTSCTDPGNNFPNLLACRKKCMTRINPICLANKPEGKCGGTRLGRYYFDPKLDQCVYFTTSCPDNPSIFQSHAECTWTCHSEH